MTLQPTPSQTVGPFFWFGLCERRCNELVDEGTPGAIQIRGQVLDGAGAPAPDAMVEIWGADEQGRYRPDFGWGRCGTDAGGGYWFRTVKPGPCGEEAPHLEVLVFARGLLKPLATRIYFPDEAAANERDPLLRAADPDERRTLVAFAEADGLRFDIRLQGDGQTAFLAR